MVYRLCRLDLKVKSKESLLGLFWYTFWPIVQSGGYVLIFNIIKLQGVIGDDVFRQLLVVLIWTQFSIMVVYSFGLISQNIEIIKNLIFPFYNSITSEILNRFLFFLITFVPLIIFYLINQADFSIFFIINLILFLISLVLITVSFSWFGSIIGMVIPDISGIFMIISTFFIAFSNLFLDISNSDNIIYQIIYTFNPVNFIINIFDNIFISYVSEKLLLLFTTSIILYTVSLFSVKALFKEILKLV